MSGWLLDTNVISALRKPAYNPAVKQWADRQNPDLLYVSRVTLAEVRYGIERLDDGERKVQLEQWLENTLRPFLGDRVLEIDEDVILRWRQMVEKGRKQGRTFSQPDLFIAATADIHGLTVVTRNVSDFAMAGVPIFNPWETDE
ncbi:MAG: type II toxin-antitoxin system VapC family toxin [Cyanobacteria bacterium P01_G01_bin.4]